MTTADGRVVSTTKIVDNGPATLRCNVVIMGDGYTAAELPQYALDVQNFVNRFRSVAPFTELWGAINVYRVDVISTDSGADDPLVCADGSAGTGTVAATFFDSTFCFGGSTRRVLYGNEATALTIAAQQEPQVRITMVMVNTPHYGGGGGLVAWFSTHRDSAEIAIHETGHSFFRLIDEYGDIINNFAGMEPVNPNITADTNRATTKWRTLILSGTSLGTMASPGTMANPNCTMEDNRPSPVPVGTVGLFEGGGRAHCGLYRPEYDCKMRHLGQPFCAVCQQHIRTILEPFGGIMTWEITGNSAVDPANNFLGTRDNSPLIIKTNGAERLRVDASGTLAIKQNVTVGAGGSGTLKVRYIDGKDYRNDNPELLFLNPTSGMPVWIGQSANRAGLWVSGDATIGAGGSGTLKVRYIDGKDYRNDNPDLLFLNATSGMPVWVGQPAKRAGLWVSGDTTIGAGGSGTLKVRLIEGKDFRNDNPDLLFLNPTSRKPVWVGQPTAQTNLYISGDATVGAGANGALKVRHIDGKDFRSDNPDALHLNFGTGRPVHIGSPSAPASLIVNGRLGIGNQTPGFPLHVVDTNSAGGISAEYTGSGSAISGVGMGNSFAGVTGLNQGIRAGMVGWSTQTTTTSFGVVGLAGPNAMFPQAAVNGGVGVWGSSPAGTGVLGTSRGEGIAGNGVEGQMESSTFIGAGLHGLAFSQLGVGIFAENDTRTMGGLAGRFLGGVVVNGRVSASAKSFRIDHPLDPANKYLNHSSIESPDMINVYNGNVTTNDSGEAVVQLPHYFGALNRDFTYQLTVIGGFAQAAVDREIENNRFVIRSDRPEVKISWQVTGVRKDAYAEAHRILVEEEKSEMDRGRYLHPEFYPVTSASPESSRPIGWIPSMFGQQKDVSTGQIADLIVAQPDEDQ
jgi:IgA Peptidase M64